LKLLPLKRKIHANNPKTILNLKNNARYIAVTIESYLCKYVIKNFDKDGKRIGAIIWKIYFSYITGMFALYIEINKSLLS